MYNFFDTPFATSSVYGFYNLSKKISQNNFDTVFTGLAGNAINSGYYQSYMFNLADLKNNNKLFNFELQEWVRLHSTKDFPKSKKILDLFLDQYIDSEIPGKLHDKIIWLSDKKIIKKNFLKNIRLKSELLNLNNYLNSSILYTLFYDSVATASDNEDWIDWILDLETVSPFGNKELVKLGMNLPDNLKINSGINRTMIRKCFKNILPSEIINDVNTIGFKLPVDEWFRSDLKEFFMDTILSKNFRQRGIYNLKFFDEIVKEHMTKKKNNSMLMWQAINFEAWALKWRPEF
jgi:asparagine synthase (glutamine-hydrolysing)